MDQKKSGIEGICNFKNNFTFFLVFLRWRKSRPSWGCANPRTPEIQTDPDNIGRTQESSVVRIEEGFAQVWSHLPGWYSTDWPYWQTKVRGIPEKCGAQTGGITQLDQRVEGHKGKVGDQEIYRMFKLILLFRQAKSHTKWSRLAQNSTFPRKRENHWHWTCLGIGRRSPMCRQMCRRMDEFRATNSGTFTCTRRTCCQKWDNHHYWNPMNFDQNLALTLCYF